MTTPLIHLPYYNQFFATCIWWPRVAYAFVWVNTGSWIWSANDDDAHDGVHVGDGVHDGVEGKPGCPSERWALGWSWALRLVLDQGGQCTLTAVQTTTYNDDDDDDDDDGNDNHHHHHHMIPWWCNGCTLPCKILRIFVCPAQQAQWRGFHLIIIIIIIIIITMIMIMIIIMMMMVLMVLTFLSPWQLPRLVIFKSWCVE